MEIVRGRGSDREEMGMGIICLSPEDQCSSAATFHNMRAACQKRKKGGREEGNPLESSEKRESDFLEIYPFPGKDQGVLHFSPPEGPFRLARMLLF